MTGPRDAAVETSWARALREAWNRPWRTDSPIYDALVAELAEEERHAVAE